MAATTTPLDEQIRRMTPVAAPAAARGQIIQQQIDDEVASAPGVTHEVATDRVMSRYGSDVESMTNFGPHSLEKLEPGGTMEVVFWEKEIAGEIRELTKRVYMDPATGQKFALEVSSGPLEVPRATAAPGAPGMGIPARVQTVSKMTLTKVVVR